MKKVFVFTTILILLALACSRPGLGASTPEPVTQPPPTPDRAGPSPCGDGVCDAAEQANPNLCPADCAGAETGPPTAAVEPTTAPRPAATFPEPTSIAEQPVQEQPEVRAEELRPAEEEQMRGCVSDPAPRFTAPVTDLSKIDFISPIGVVTHSIIFHSYIWIGRDESGQAYEVPIYAPVDSVLTMAAYYSQPMQNEQGQWVDVAQYLLFFYASCEVYYKFDHIDRLVENLAAVVPAVPSASSRTEDVRPPLFVKAGDLIGYTRGTITAHNWDFGVYNSSKPNQFINQERYEVTYNLSSSLYADCPYDYFDDGLRSRYYALLPGGDCGSGSHDKPGTISGAWFAQADFGPFGGGSALAIGITVVSESEFVVVRSEGSEIQVYPGRPTYAGPQSVTSEHCYQHSEDPPRFVYLQLLSDMELAVVYGEGPCPHELPAGYQVYYR